MPKLIIAMLVLQLSLALSGCSLFGGGGDDDQPRPQWANDQTTGRFDTSRYLVGKGIAPMSGDPVADTRAVRDSAKADMLGQLITEVAAEFRNQVSEFSLGDKWTSASETMSNVRTNVQGVLDVALEEEFYRDTKGRTIYALLAVERSKYGASLRHRLQTIQDEQKALIQDIEARIAAGSNLDALRGIAKLQATVPNWISTGASLASVAGQGARPNPTVTPELLARLNNEARAKLLVFVDVQLKGGSSEPKLDSAAVLSDVSAALQALRIPTTSAATTASHRLTVTVTPHANQVHMPESGLRFAVASISWHLAMAAISGSDYGFTAANKSDSNRVSKAGTNVAQALAEARSKASLEMRQALASELN